jgi:hypothetical protein
VTCHISVDFVKIGLLQKGVKRAILKLRGVKIATF